MPYLEAVVLVGDASGVYEEFSERVEDAVAVGGAEVEVLVGEDVGDVVDDGLVHLVDDVAPQHLPHDPHAGHRHRPLGVGVGGLLPCLATANQAEGFASLLATSLNASACFFFLPFPFPIPYTESRPSWAWTALMRLICPQWAWNHNRLSPAHISIYFLSFFLFFFNRKHNISYY